MADAVWRTSRAPLEMLIRQLDGAITGSLVAMSYESLTKSSTIHTDTHQMFCEQNLDFVVV